ncbi:MAG: adenylyl-sulfate kinase [Bacteroidales bacterium]|nr:adenylyl-sulfate kinase [Bacteroidales bacterium]
MESLRVHKEQLIRQRALSIWFTGLPASGKSTLAIALEQAFTKMGILCCRLDADIVRQGINKDLGYELSDRKENIRRVAYLNRYMLDSGLVVLNSFIQPTNEIRNMAAGIVGHEDYFEVFVNCPLEECEKRDPKGHYQKARNGMLPGFTGIDSPFEEPLAPFMIIETKDEALDICTKKLLSAFLPIIKK